MDDPSGWRWIWLVAAAVLAVGELAMPGTFFLVSFAIGAAVACVLAFASVSLGLQWLAFVAASAVALAVLVPLGRRITRGPQAAGVGATRFIGLQGVVLETVPGGDTHDTGLVRIERDEWRAESGTGTELAVGTPIRVCRIEGTRLVVEPSEE